MIDSNLTKYVDGLIAKFPEMIRIRESIIDAYEILEECFANDGKLLVAGNGGSAADSEHIAGELMKSFRKPRRVNEEMKERLREIDPASGETLSQHLECGLMTIPLTTHEALSTAYLNDVNGDMVFAQQLFGYGREGDVFLGISTSGNSKNVVLAAIVAKALNMKVIGLTGRDGGRLAKLSDVCVKVPETETYLVQEMHLPIYHRWCLMLEESFFKKNDE